MPEDKYKWHSTIKGPAGLGLNQAMQALAKTENVNIDKLHEKERGGESTIVFVITGKMENIAPYRTNFMLLLRERGVAIEVEGFEGGSHI